MMMTDREIPTQFGPARKTAVPDRIDIVNLAILTRETVAITRLVHATDPMTIVERLTRTRSET